MSNPQKNTLLKTAASQPTAKDFKRVFLSPPKEKLKNKIFSTLQKNKTSFQPTMQILTDTTMTVNHFGQSVSKLDISPLRTDRRASGNIGFYASWAGHCTISHLQIPASVPADE